MTVELANWDDLDTDLVPQAIFRKSPDHFEAVLGRPLSEQHDDFDYFRGALFRVDGQFFALRQYRGHDPETTTIYLPRDFADIAEISRLVRRIAGELNLAANDIVWQRADNPEL